MPSITRILITEIRWRALYVIRKLFALTGRSWNDFYAWMLDFQDRNVTLDQILARRSAPGTFKGLFDWQRGDYYADFMGRHGVRGDHRILDYGCGYGRVTIPLLKRQDPAGFYIGTEISKKRLALAREWITRENLDKTNFDLVLSNDNSMQFLADHSINVVWVLSVFNHMPDPELDTLLLAIARVLRPGGMLFCYYLADNASGNGADAAVKTFRRSERDMIGRLTGLGFTLRTLTDFDDDLSNRDSTSRMLLAIKSTFGSGKPIAEKHGQLANVS
jgi:ubiquinone/menaquinone biosynthesis C-methylase UbiE